MKAWWENVLRNWAAAAECPYEVSTRETGSARRSGEWWLEGGYWHVQLDSRHSARFHPHSPSSAFRRAMTSTLQIAHSSSTRPWREIVTSCFADLISLSSDVEFARWEPSSAIGLPDLDSMTSLFPGYFVWVRAVHTVDGRIDDAELSDAEEVIRAFSPEGWIGWLPTPIPDGTSVKGHSCLLFFPSNGLDEDIAEAETDFQADEYIQVSTEYRELRAVRAEIAAVLSQLESDTFFPATAVISRRVSRASDIIPALRTLVTTAEAQLESTRAGRVIAWGDSLLELALYHLPELGRQTLREITMIRVPESTLALTPEFLETLRGLISANLNISEAARLLYMHRNTLLHRIDKIRSQTGYDIRNFNDALTLWLYAALSAGDGARR